MENPRSSDTIDLPRAFAQLIQLLTENFYTMLIVVLLCLGGGSLYYWLTPRTFESKMIIQSDILSESYALKMAENLNTHIRDRDADFLASKLYLTKEEAIQLKEFKVISALTPMSQQMAEQQKIIVVISVRVENNAILSKLQNGIIQYFSNNDFIKKRVEEKKKKHLSLAAALDREIKILDTLKSKISKGTFMGAKVGDIAIMDVSGLFGVSASLHERKYNIIYDLAVIDSIQIIEELTPYGKPVWPKLSVVLLTSLMLAGLIIFGSISYRSIRNQLPSKVS